LKNEIVSTGQECRRVSPELTLAVAEIGEPVVRRRDKVPDHKTGSETITEPNDASRKGHFVTYEKLP
jgi:hypothetical protein